MAATEDGWAPRSDVAALVGVSVSALCRWIEASDRAERGERSVGVVERRGCHRARLARGAVARRVQRGRRRPSGGATTTDGAPAMSFGVKGDAIVGVRTAPGSLPAPENVYRCSDRCELLAKKVALPSIPLDTIRHAPALDPVAWFAIAPRWDASARRAPLSHRTTFFLVGSCANSSWLNLRAPKSM
jgi:hypothetical protein